LTHTETLRNPAFYRHVHNAKQTYAGQADIGKTSWPSCLQLGLTRKFLDNSRSTVQ